MKRLLFAPALALALFFASCGGGSSSSDSSTAPETSTTAPAASDQAGADIPGIEDVQVTNDIVLEGRDDMTFDKTLFKVKSGEPIKIKLTNVGKLPAEAMAHNVVVLLPGTNVQEFGEAAVAAKDNAHIPQDMIADVLGHTKMLGPGESDSIEVTFPNPGVYDFICSFPGHFGTMRGKIVAE